MSKMRAAGLLTFCLWLFAEAAPAGGVPLSLSVSPPYASQGGIVEIRVQGAAWARVSADLGHRQIPFFPAADGTYTALLGVDLDERPGSLAVVVRAVSKDGDKREAPLTLRVRERDFPREQFSAPPAFDRLDEATLKRIALERERLERLWSNVSPGRLWQGRFLRPIPGDITSPFGLRRIINGLPRAPHSGVDFRAPAGTEVFASNHGKVVVGDEFFFSGKSIVLDHGGGLYTMYFHLSDFQVREGSEVRKGDVIGWVGMTGRVTGPHLHWGVRMNGSRVDPVELLEKVSDSP